MVLAHPTGRLLQDREPYDVDMERVIREARETGCVLELNAQPDRLDLDDIYCKMAKEMGVLISISSDAHSADELDFMRYGILQARRGWLEPLNVINTRSRKELNRILKKTRRERTGLNQSEWPSFTRCLEKQSRLCRSGH
jgi:DNA polymerase (family 10)